MLLLLGAWLCTLSEAPLLLTRVTGCSAIAEHRRLLDGVLRLDHGADEVQLFLLTWHLKPGLTLLFLWRVKYVTSRHDREVFFNIHLSLFPTILFLINLISDLEITYIFLSWA